MTAFRLTHIGGPTVLIEAEGWRVLTDPTFDAPGQTYKFGWGSKSTKLSGPAGARRRLRVLLHADIVTDATRRALQPQVG